MSAVRKAVLAVVLLASFTFAATRIYWIGNSVTDALQYGDWVKSAESAGEQIEWGRHMIPGAPIGWIWEHPDGICESPYGCYPNALNNYTWDVVSLQPYDWGLDSDIDYGGRFIELTLKKSPQCMFVIFGHYPRQSNIDKHGGYQQAWVQPHTGGYDGSNEFREFYEKLADALNQNHNTATPVVVVPVGEVYFELDKKMRAGEFPGKSDIVSAAYKDGIHQNEFGNYIVGCSYFATIFRKAPTNFTEANYEGVSSEQAAIIKQTVWDVVSTYEHAGVAGSVATRRPLTVRRANLSASGSKRLYSLQGRALESSVRGVANPLVGPDGLTVVR